jgi:hypothetical protein
LFLRCTHGSNAASVGRATAGYHKFKVRLEDEQQRVIINLKSDWRKVKLANWRESLTESNSGLSYISINLIIRVIIRAYP